MENGGCGIGAMVNIVGEHICVLGLITNPGMLKAGGF